VSVVPTDDDFGFVMHDALMIDDAATLARHRALHAAFEARQRREQELLRALRVDFVFSNVGHEPIAAARALGLPAFAGCSLNWASLFAQRYPDEHAIADTMRRTYGGATRLFELEPGMPFELPGAMRVGPIGRTGVRRRAELWRLLGLQEGRRLMLVAFGGTPMPLTTAGWRLPKGWSALVFAPQVAGTDVFGPPESIADWPFADLVASCDVLVAKPGYGTFVEAGFVGRPTIAVARDDWPETPFLVDWLSAHARCAHIAVESVAAGDFEAALAALAAQPDRPVARGDGAREIADRVAIDLGAATGM
jgi:hypothetical protein